MNKNLKEKKAGLRMAIHSNQKGTMILIGILVLAIVITMSLGISSIVMSQIKMGGMQNKSTVAYFAAEAAAEKILYSIRKLGYRTNVACINQYLTFNQTTGAITGCTPNITDSGTTFTLSNNASFQVQYLEIGFPVNATYKCIGNMASSTRVVEISYEI